MTQQLVVRLAADFFGGLLGFFTSMKLVPVSRVLAHVYEEGGSN